MNLDKKKIPIFIINGRFTKKSFKRWKIFPRFSNYIFSKISLCLSADEISAKYLKKLGVKKIKQFGNLKFSQSETDKPLNIETLKKFTKNKKVWCASSTHYNEEKFCGLVHMKLKKKYKNLLTIIIPRHIERTSSIKKDLSNMGLKIEVLEPTNNIPKDTDIYIINSYGKTKSIYNICSHVFLGGSLINHGGQNPLEATRYNCNIFHGPNVNNFKDIYNYLNYLNVSIKIKNSSQLVKKLNYVFSKKNKSKNIKNKLNKIGNKILGNSYNEINKLLINDI